MAKTIYHRFISAPRLAVESYLREFDDFWPLYGAFLIEGYDRPELRSRGIDCSKAFERVTVRFLMAWSCERSQW